MINIPDEIKNLYLMDGIRKNIRISFPNGEHDDITNDNIGLDSVKFTESTCSSSDIKLGMSEASIFECELYEVPNLRGCYINVDIEIDISSLPNEFITEYGLTSSDVPFVFYKMPYGQFIVDEHRRKAGSKVSNVVAYDALALSVFHIDEKQNILKLFPPSGYVGNNGYLGLKKFIHSLVPNSEYVSDLHIGEWKTDTQISRRNASFSVTFIAIIGDAQRVGRWYEDRGYGHVYDECNFKYRRVDVECEEISFNAGANALNKLIEIYGIDYINFDSVSALQQAYKDNDFLLPCSDDFSGYNGAWTISNGKLYRIKKLTAYTNEYRADEKKQICWGHTVYQEEEPAYYPNRQKYNELMSQPPISGVHTVQEIRDMYNGWHVSYVGGNFYENLSKSTSGKLKNLDVNVDSQTYCNISPDFKYREIISDTNFLTNGFDLKLNRSSIEEIDFIYYTDLMADLAEIIGCFCRINRKTHEFDFYDIKAGTDIYPLDDLYPSNRLFPRDSSAHVYYRGEYRDVDYEDYLTRPIGRIALSVSSQLYEATVPNYDPNDYSTIVIDSDNFYIENSIDDSKSFQILVNEVLNKVKGIYFRPFNGEFIGMPWLESGDSIRVETIDGFMDTFIMRRTLSGVQLLTDSLSAEGDDNATSVF